MSKTKEHTPNTLVIREDGIVEIYLDKEQIGLIDEIDIPKLQGIRWYALMGGSNNYHYVAGGSPCRYLHKLILDTNKEVDHKNEDGLDNRRENLRIASHSCNVHNRQGPRRDNKSGFKGVYKKGSSYVAQIRKDGVLYTVGVYPLAEAAADAYDRAARELYGEFFAGSRPKEKQ